MSPLTALDHAHAAMQAAPDDDAARLRFFERLADSELFLLLEREAQGELIEPRAFDLDDGPVVLVFDREERLAEFAGGEVPYAALSGRTVVKMLGGQGIGLGVNLDVAPSAIILPEAALTWLGQTLAHAPQETQGRPEALHPPAGLPEILLGALDAKLATATGLARMAYLAGVTYEDGRRGHLLGFIDALDGATPALAKAASEALTFSGLEAGEMDVAFFAASDPMSARMARVGLRFDLPEHARNAPAPPKAPGSDPDKPPVLR